jgi:hypothetical protein
VRAQASKFSLARCSGEIAPPVSARPGWRRRSRQHLQCLL